MQNAVHRSKTRIQRPGVGWSQLCAHSSLSCRLVYGLWRSGCGPTWPNGVAVVCGVVVCPLCLGYGSWEGVPVGLASTACKDPFWGVVRLSGLGGGGDGVSATVDVSLLRALPAQVAHRGGGGG